MKGSAGSGKSRFAAKKLILRTLTEGNHKWLVSRKVQKTIRESVFESIRRRIHEWGLPNRVFYHENKSELKIWLKDSEFIFMGLDDPEKLKSIEGITGAFLEEMTEFEEEDFDQINIRMRDTVNNYRQTLCAFNPINEQHWIKKRFYDQDADVSFTRHESRYTDNPFLDDDYRQMLEGYKDTNPLYYQVYCLNQWGVVDTSNKFLYAFSKDTHVQKCKASDSAAIRLSFDFNIDPFAVLVYQRLGDTVNVIDHIRLPNSDIEQVCDAILGRYGEQQFIVTGDASGKGRTGVVRGKRSYWEVILNRLNIRKTDTARVRVRSKNLDLLESRVLCNLVLQNEKITICIDPKNDHLINDCLYANVDDRGILVKDRNKQKNDFLDAFRYLLDAEFPHIVRNPKKYK